MLQIYITLDDSVVAAEKSIGDGAKPGSTDPCQPRPCARSPFLAFAGQEEFIHVFDGYGTNITIDPAGGGTFNVLKARDRCLALIVIVGSLCLLCEQYSLNANARFYIDLLLIGR